MQFSCGHGVAEEEKQKQAVEARMKKIRRIVLVISGKGGVGKSTVAVNLATALFLAGNKVGLLDADIHGPSVPTMLGLEGAKPCGGDDGILPVDAGGLKVLSMGLFLKNQDDALIWRGPMRTSAVKQLMEEADWGELDYLIIDTPPGTGDELLAVCQGAGEIFGAVVVTTPQKVAARDVRKSITFCRELQVRVLGIVENMSGFVCPHCGQLTQILRRDGGRKIATDMNVSFLGAIPLDPLIADACDDGNAFIHRCRQSDTADIMQDIIDQIGRLK